MSCHLYAFLNLIWVGIYITYIVFSGKIIKKYNHSYNSKYIQKYLDNWASKPISSIKFVSNITTDCKDGNIITLANFPGTKTFCDCNGTFSKGFCKTEDFYDCKSFYFFEEDLKVTKWINDKYLCVFYSDFTYQYIRENLRYKNCENKKDCGYFDSFRDSKICLSDTKQDCPIKKIPPSIKKKVVRYLSDANEEIDYNSESESESSSDSNDMIITNITLSSGNLPCFHPYEGLFGENEFKYNNLKGKKNCETKTNNHDEYDHRYNNFETTKLEKLGEKNNFYYGYLNSSTEFKNQYNENVSLSYTGYFGLSNDCYEKYKNDSDIVNLKMSKSLLITIIVLTSVFLLINFGFCLFAVFSCLEICDLREEYLDEPLTVQIIFRWLMWTLNLIFLTIINIKYFKKRNNVKNTIKECFVNDDISIYAYNLACDNFYNIKNYFIVFDILFGVELLTNIIGNSMFCLCESELGQNY
jgi:hypothetical protein